MARSRVSLTIATDSDADFERAVGFDSAGTPTHLRLQRSASNFDESVTTPQALRNVLRDPVVASVLRSHREQIFDEFVKVDTTGDGSVHTTEFRRILREMDLGFRPDHIEDLIQSLQFLGRLEREGSSELPSIRVSSDELHLLMVPYSHLFSSVQEIAELEEAAAAAVAEGMFEKEQEEEEQEEVRSTQQHNTPCGAFLPPAHTLWRTSPP